VDRVSQRGAAATEKNKRMAIEDHQSWPTAAAQHLDFGSSSGANSRNAQSQSAEQGEGTDLTRE